MRRTGFWKFIVVLALVLMCLVLDGHVSLGDQRWLEFFALGLLALGLGLVSLFPVSRIWTLGGRVRARWCILACLLLWARGGIINLRGLMSGHGALVGGLVLLVCCVVGFKIMLVGSRRGSGR
jgi:hypothetical protein